MQSRLSTENFKITDANYGDTLDIYLCPTCGFYQCSSAEDIQKFYAEMEDEDYEDARGQRAIQARHLLKCLQKHINSGRLLDVGAASGVLVEQALDLGYQAEGIEPSTFLYRNARALGLPVLHEIIPHAEIVGPYDIITLIDVIEHVSDPVTLLRQATSLLAPDGILVVVTPNVKAPIARLLGWNWWHFRIAHIGYFNRASLSKLLARVDLAPFDWSSPTWYFPASYLYERALRYLPDGIRHAPPKFMSKLVVPINLFDSFMVICRKQLEDDHQRM